jgi:hypothetical protein
MYEMVELVGLCSALVSVQILADELVFGVKFEIVFATIAAAGCIVDLKLAIVFIPFHLSARTSLSRDCFLQLYRSGSVTGRSAFAGTVMAMRRIAEGNIRMFCPLFGRLHRVADPPLLDHPQASVELQVIEASVRAKGVVNFKTFVGQDKSNDAAPTVLLHHQRRDQFFLS